MPNYKLQYFGFRGKGEFIRYLFHYNSVDFEDFSIERNDWANIFKAESPMGQMPLLYVDGEVMCQTTAIGAYLGETFDMAGDFYAIQFNLQLRTYEAARCIMLSGGIEDQSVHGTKIAVAFWSGQDHKDVKVISDAYANGELKVWATRYNQFLDENGGQFFVGNRLSWVDIQIAEFVGKMHIRCTAAFEDTPNLLDHTKRVLSHKKLIGFVTSRKKHLF